jgi:streptogramin lyase
MSGTITSYYYSSDPRAWGIAPDGAGNFWIGGDELWKVSSSGTLLATLTLPSGSQISGGLVGPDGNPWFSDNENNNLYQVDSAASTYTTFTFRESGYSPPNIGGSSVHAGRGVLGADSNMWCIDESHQNIVKCITLGDKIVMLL